MGNYKRFTIVMIIFMLCLLFGCSSSKPNSVSSDTDHFDMNCDQYCYIKSLGGFPSMVSSELGYYFKRKTTSTNLFYTDKATMKTVLLCDKPNCLHSDETDKTKRDECNAYLDSDNTVKIGDLLFYNSALFYFRVRSEYKQTQEYLLTKISLDGKQRDDVYTFKNYPQYIIIHKGFLYYSTSDNGTVGGKEKSTISKSGLYRIPMSDLGKAPELLYENNGIYAQVGGLIGYKNNIYFSCFSYQDSKLQNSINNLMCYQINTGKTIDISDNAKGNAICGDKIVYAIDDENKCICDLNGEHKTNLKGIIGDLYCDDKYVITDTLFLKLLKAKDNQGNPIKRSLNIYSLSGERLQTFDLDEYKGASILGSDSGYIFLETTNSDKNNKMFCDCWRIDKKKVASGSANLERYYSYSYMLGTNLD